MEAEIYKAKIIYLNCVVYAYLTPCRGHSSSVKTINYRMAQKLTEFLYALTVSNINRFC